ncbi:Hypothetical predicted protein, partial [Olea europaea subsp. europaea]
MQHLNQDDFDLVSKEDAKDIRKHLVDKYLVIKENSGVSEASHQLRQNNITDLDSYDQALAKMNKVITALSVLRKAKLTE